MKTLAIVGAGPGLGLSLAKTLGLYDYRVALIARSQEKLDSYVQQLQALHIEAVRCTADVMNISQLQAALDRVKETLGPVDLLEYSPLPNWTAEPSSAPVSVLDVTCENAISQFQMSVLGAIASVKAVLPDMLTRGSGTIFFTTGLSAIVPLPFLGNAGIAMAGLRNYAYTLHEAFAAPFSGLSHRM